MGSIYEQNLGGYELTPVVEVPMVTPIPIPQFRYKSGGATEGKKTIQKFNEQLPKTIPAILILYEEAMKELGVKSPYWADLKLRFDVEASNLHGYAGLLFETSDPLRFKLKIDYRGMVDPAIRSNIVHEVGAHVGESLLGKDISERATERKSIDTLHRIGDEEAANFTEKYSGYIGKQRVASPRNQYPMYV